MATLVPLPLIEPALMEQLLDAAFGPDRHERTAYKIRVGTAFLPNLSFAVLDESEYVVGLIQAWPVALTDPQGKRHPMVMVGPVAVLPAHQGEGYGKMLMLALIDAIDNSDESAPPLPQVMIGDPQYYGRFFGFSAAHTGGWDCPGPFEKERLLVRCFTPAILPLTGMLGPWKS